MRKVRSETLTTRTSHRPEPVHHLLAVLAVPVVPRLKGDVADDMFLRNLNQVDGADVSALLADGRGDLAEHSGQVADLQSDGHAVAGARRLNHGGSSLGA